MEIQTRYDFFEPNDTTALICIDEPEIQRLVFEQLAPSDYKIHTGLFSEDIVLKLKAHIYDVLIIYENFNHSDLETNQILKAAASTPSSQRRQQFLVLLGPSMVTNDEMLGFVNSVDLVFSLSDLANFGIVLRRALVRHREFFNPIRECLQEIGSI